MVKNTTCTSFSLVFRTCRYKADLQGFISQQLNFYGLHITDDIPDDAERKQESANIKLILIKSYRATQRSLRNTNKIIRLTEKYQSLKPSHQRLSEDIGTQRKKILLFAVLNFSHRTRTEPLQILNTFF